MNLLKLVRQKETSGSKAALMVAAGIGLTAFMNADSLLALTQPVLDMFSVDVASSTRAKSTTGLAGWLGSWAFLHQRWKRKRKRIRTLVFIGIFLLVLIVAGIIPKSLFTN